MELFNIFRKVLIVTITHRVDLWSFDYTEFYDILIYLSI